jgi:hypothetical protein
MFSAGRRGKAQNFVLEKQSQIITSGEPGCAARLVPMQCLILFF